MSKVVLIDYGCHGFTHRLATYLADLGYPICYFANGSLESPNLTSLGAWHALHPNSMRVITAAKPYGKIGLRLRLEGEVSWAKSCIAALEEERPSALILSTVPLTVTARLEDWASRRDIPIIYWLQDLQGRAIHDLLGYKLGMPGRVVGAFAYLWEQHILERSRMVITIAKGHERELPAGIQRSHKYELLENWADLEAFPLFPVTNGWSLEHGLNTTSNVMYSGTLGLKHDLETFIALASHFRHHADVRIVVVSSGEASEVLRKKASAAELSNLMVMPFQPYNDVPMVLASASVLIAPLDPSAGNFCVPSKVLSYFCAGRPTVIAIDKENPAAKTIRELNAGRVVAPKDRGSFVSAVEVYLSDAELRMQSGQRARAYAEETFALDKVAQKFLAILSRADIHLTATFLSDHALAAAR